MYSKKILLPLFHTRLYYILFESNPFIWISQKLQRNDANQTETFSTENGQKAGDTNQHVVSSIDIPWDGARKESMFRFESEK